jgi:PhnB protein
LDRLHKSDRRRIIRRSELARPNHAALTPAARKHRLPSDDTEDIFAAWLDRVAGGMARHEQDAVLVGWAPYPDLLGCHVDILSGKNVQDHRSRRLYAPSMSITPHIVVQGADRAVAFYRDAFGAEEVSRIPTPDGCLMSVQLPIGDEVLHIADEFPEMGVLAPSSIGGTPVVLALEVADADAVFADAVAAGATVRQPVQDMFWGDRHGQLEDPFGHRDHPPLLFAEGKPPAPTIGAPRREGQLRRSICRRSLGAGRLYPS